MLIDRAKKILFGKLKNNARLHPTDVLFLDRVSLN